MFCLDFILNALVFGEKYTDFLNIENKLDLILRIFNTQISIDDFVCTHQHPLKPIITKIFRSYTNIFLKRSAEFKNGLVSEQNVRKLKIFENQVRYVCTDEMEIDD